MNTPEPDDKPVADLLAAADRDAPMPDRAFLDRLRDQSMAAFAAAAKPHTLRERIMLRASFRWVAACAAAVLVLGVVIAKWVMSPEQPPQVKAPEFRIEPGLVDDGRIGNVTDAQGIVSVKPVLAERWSPVVPRLVLKPGDWLRTDSRGANAVAVRLLKSAAAIVGPHSTVELVKATELRLIAGEIELTATEQDPVELHGPDKRMVKVTGKALYRVEKEKLVKADDEPKWLQGFKGTTTADPVGSLIAKIDGRDTPLTVGYHHVTVEIRDQIARTTIVESFVNRTKVRCEGVFHFPLPQDASISGFGMWIGNQLVEADVVEKQRAREIYEQILRENRDPGLLEWTGGNIFKARVFPIEAHSEKRIKISYTQVLPLQGNRYRYSYALASEMLKSHPLRDLKIDVKVNSARPIKAVSSPTHPARVTKTDNAGHVEFTAQEYTPTRDFEAVVEVAGRSSDVVLIPHRRGDDGYFLVQLTPPGGDGDWERPLVPTGEPVKLLVLADTSASMDKAQRTAQRGVIAGLLGALTAKDTVNVAACDVSCTWAFDKPRPATPDAIAAIDALLTPRHSLGWTDLDKAFASALAVCEPGTHVVYVGDGIVTTGDADAVAFAKRVKQAHQGKSGTFHAVSTGSSFEPLALKAMASLGGGSFRRVSGEKGPQATALELLTEIAAPTLRDLKVEFVGFQTARVYPETLPNVAAGTQQILLGRYLPVGNDQAGEVVVTGTLGGKPVRFASKVSLADAEAGNSFIPRLWARMHLDKLLEQGASEVVKRDIIALSEEFNIITPYTSLLVLETDADRERFAVKRRFQMRDGERFFKDGVTAAEFELKQKQMSRAGDYRTAVRRAVLAQLTTLGRNPNLFNPQREYAGRPMKAAYAGDHLLRLGDYDGDISFESFSSADGMAVEFEFAKRLEEGRVDEFRGITHGSRLGVEFHDDEGMDKELLNSDLGLATNMPAGEPMSKAELSDFRTLAGLEVNGTRYTQDAPEALGEFGFVGRSVTGRPGYGHSQRLWLNTLFPTLVGPPAPAKEPKTAWPANAVALSKSLLRTDAVGRVVGGVMVTNQTDTFDRRNELSSRSRRLDLVSQKAWLSRTSPDGGPVIVNWCDGTERGAFSTAFQLGRARKSEVADLTSPLDLADFSTHAIHATYAKYAPAVEVIDKDRSLLILKPRGTTDTEVRFLIDTTRRVLLSVEYRHKGKVTGATRFEDFVEVAGAWWARRVETLNEKGERASLATQTVAELSADEFTKKFAAELAGKAKVLFLRAPMPKVTDAKAAVVTGKATFDDRAALVLHFGASQQWARAREHLDACEKLAAGKSGMRWLSGAFLLVGRRHEELRKRLYEDAAALAATTDADALANSYALAEHLFSEARGLLSGNELIALVELLRRSYDRQPPHLQALKTWRQRHNALLRQYGQPDVALAGLKLIAADFPRDADVQYQYAQQLAASGDYPAAYTWLTKALEGKWLRHEEASLRDLFAGFLNTQGRFRELADYLAESLKRDSESEHAHAFYLSALVRSNQVERAETTVREWLREALAAAELTPSILAKANAAVRFSLGDGYQISTNRIDEKWHALLAEVALHFARRGDNVSTANLIISHHRFSSTDAASGVRKALADDLKKNVAALTATQLDYIVTWAFNYVAEADREKLAADIRTKWDAATNPDVKHQLAQPLYRVLSHLGGDKQVEFLRVQWRAADDEYRSSYANQLFNALLSRPWAAAVEDELFTMLDKLADPEDATGPLVARIAALHRLTDAMLDARYKAKANAIERPEKLTRTELQEKQDALRNQAREQFADRLKAEAAKHAKPFADWLTAERLWLDALLERDPKAIAAECWAVLDGPAPKSDESPAVRSDAMLRARLLTLVENLASRKAADPALVDRVLKYVDGKLAQGTDLPRWRGEKHKLLVAFDRAADLERELRQWAAGPDPDNRWRLALGFLLAEQGKIADAIKEFEAVEAADELTPDAYRTLSDWYLVEKRRAEHEKARAQTYLTAEEYQLSRRLRAYLSPWQSTSGRLPSKLDPEVLTVFRVLFEKSESPQSYLWQLQQFYQASRDFELLSMLPDGVLGHTAGKVYPFVSSMSAVLGEIRDEATADELLKRVAALRQPGRTVVDLRALDFLEVMVERRAAELQNQAGPHAEKALAALRRAFHRDRSAGEPRLMADFLANLGAVGQAALAAEQLGQLESLHRTAAAGSFDRLQIALRYAETLNAYSRLPEATDRLLAAVKEYETASGGTLPASAQSAFDRLIGFTESAGHFDRGEKLMLAQLARPIHAEQKNWIDQRLFSLYRSALARGGEVSLGKGADLYKAVEKKLLDALPTPDRNRRAQLLGQLCGVYRTAQEHKVADSVADVKAFAFKVVPPILPELVNNYDGVVSDVANTLHRVVGPRDGIAFLLDCAETEPAWALFLGQDAWTRHHHRLGEWRTLVKDLGDLEPRLLKFVLAELKRDLTSRQSRGRNSYHRGHAHYWEAKEADFAAAAEEVLAAKGNSSAAVEYVADYLYHGLHRKARAIDLLFAAHKRGVLDEGARWHLTGFLHQHGRFAESIGLLQPLVEKRPDNFEYRRRLMHAYSSTGKQAELLALLKDTHTFFHQKERWGEGVLAGLAASTLENKLFRQSAAYFDELIPMHKKSHPERGNGVLSGYYRQAAEAFAGLGDTKSAVDRASAAVVCWGPTHSNRAAALDTLVSVLAASADLPGYAAGLDEEKLQSAVVRKAVGKAFVRKNDHARAAKQLLVAVDLQPEDAETRQLLVECFDKLGDKEKVIGQLLGAVEASPRDIKLYQQLGTRYAALNRPADSERAFTSIVEMLPTETESHTVLAEVREKQGRWRDAILHWERVAALRALEPTGLVKLAGAQIGAGDWDAAAATVKKLRSQSWPPRFNEVEKQTRDLERKLEGRPK